MVLKDASVLRFIKECLIGSTKGDHQNAQDTLHEKHFCFVQYLDVIGKGDLSIDGIDEKLAGLRLRWHRSDKDTKQYSSIEYRPVPVERLRGKFQVVEGDFAKLLRKKCTKSKFELSVFRNDKYRWSAKIYYVNRFYLAAESAYKYD